MLLWDTGIFVVVMAMVTTGEASSPVLCGAVAMGSTLSPMRSSWSKDQTESENPTSTPTHSSKTTTTGLLVQKMRLKLQLSKELASIPGSLKLPPFLPTENVHNHWTFCRIFSQEIENVLEKHSATFDKDYLSALLLGEVFHERAVVTDDEQDFDSSVFFQALKVDRCHPQFRYGKDKSRLRIECSEVDTSSNVSIPKAEKQRSLIAFNLLADLMASCVRFGDILVIFGDMNITKSKVIALNGRLQHHVVIAQFRKDGFLGPIDLQSVSQQLKDIEPYCRSPRFTCQVHENGRYESSLMLTPNV